jgi:hypothetical protein
VRTVRWVLEKDVPVNPDRDTGAASFWKLYLLEVG